MNILETIVQSKLSEIIEQRAEVPLEDLQELLPTADRPRGFAAGLRQRARLNQPPIIAELKFGSPSRGLVRKQRDAERICIEYVENGATALSVLTDAKYFFGSLSYVPLIRDRLRIQIGQETPLLRKDFIVDPYQVWQTRVMGADAILLIVAALEQPLLESLLRESLKLGLDVLIEAHSEEELERAVTARTTCGTQARIDLPAPENGTSQSAPAAEVLLGINCRDLKTFERDLKVTERLLTYAHSLLAKDPAGPGTLLIAESGIERAEQIHTLTTFGASGFLIGSSLMFEGSPGANLKRLLADCTSTSQVVA